MDRPKIIILCEKEDQVKMDGSHKFYVIPKKDTKIIIDAHDFDDLLELRRNRKK